MGTWGPGLYSNDIAKDLKSTIAAVARLPLDITTCAYENTEDAPKATTTDSGNRIRCHFSDRRYGRVL